MGCERLGGRRRPPRRRLTEFPVVVSAPYSESMRRISARRAVAGTGLDPAAFAVVLASFKRLRVKREPRRRREAERGPG
jgi:hypothetical protein